MSGSTGRRRPSRPPALSTYVTLVTLAAAAGLAVAAVSPSVSLGHALLILLPALAGAVLALRHLLAFLGTSEGPGEREREREELAGLLHDDVSPRLVALGYQLDRLGRTNGHDAEAALRAARDATRAAQQRVRALIGDLLSQSADPEAADRVVEGIVDEVGDHVQVVRYLDPQVTDGPAAELLFGVAREALRNAVRHGRADRVDIVLRRKGAGALLVVSDDGQGFDPEAVARRDGHYGLRLLRRRVESAGGVFSLVSAPGHGTVLTCEVPLAERVEEAPDGAESGVSRAGGR